MAEEKIVTAVGIASSASKGGRRLGLLIEAAQAAAVLECNAKGITTEEKNSHIIRKAMQDARQRVLDEVAAQEKAVQKKELG